MGAEFRRVEPGQDAAALDDQVDRLRRQRALLHAFPLVDGTENRPLGDVGALEPEAQRVDRRPDQQDGGVVVGRGGFGAQKRDSQAGQARGIGIAGVEGDRRLVAQLLDAQARDFAAPAAARAEGDQQQRAVAAIGEPVGAAGGEQPVEDVAGDGAKALAPARPRAGAHGEPHRGAQRRGGERTVEPAPAMQRAPTGEPALDRRGRMRTVDAQGAGGGQRGGDLGRHAVGGVDLALGGIPQVMGDEFQRQALGRRPGQGGVRVAACAQASR